MAGLHVLLRQIMQNLHQSRAAQLGTLAGTTVRGLLWINDQIDWEEVAQIVIHGLKILVVLTLLAGQATRRGWDALVAASEQLGQAYSRLLVPTAPPAPAEAPAPATRLRGLQQLQALGQELEHLEALTQRQLMAMAGTRRKLAKRQLVAMLAAA